MNTAEPTMTTSISNAFIIIATFPSSTLHSPVATTLHSVGDGVDWMIQRKVRAFIATMTVLAAMSAAPAAGDSTTPAETSAPAASGIAITL